MTERLKFACDLGYYYAFDDDAVTVRAEAEEPSNVEVEYQDLVTLQSGSGVQQRGWLDIALLCLHDDDDMVRWCHSCWTALKLTFRLCSLD